MPPAPPCPCSSGQRYSQCCAPYHRGAEPPDAERLMRSRYSAFAVGDSAYLSRTWHPSTRPATVKATGSWVRLEVLASSGGLLDAEGIVHFRAHSLDGVVEERSRFTRDAGRWAYLGPV